MPGSNLPKRRLGTPSRHRSDTWQLCVRVAGKHCAAMAVYLVELHNYHVDVEFRTSAVSGGKMIVISMLRA
jgi:hypothetical protein